jgi:alkanesulfonate monooxygenase SsuD/methylene tetrahydromethanopterin reductase-like flavin-dependent oxidoreductase (luciferase family)
MQPTVTLELEQSPQMAALAGQVMLGIALAAGLPPLSADRARSAVARVVGAARSPLELRFAVDPSRATVRIQGGSEEWLRDAANRLHGQGVLDGDALVATFERPPLRLV